MKNNMSIFDRIVRAIAAIAIIYLYYSEVITGVLGIVLLVVSGIFLLTSLAGSCPLYSLLGFSTCKRRSDIR